MNGGGETMKQIRPTRKRTTAIIQAMRDNDSITMIQAAQTNGVPGDVAAEWYQCGSEWASPPVKQEFYWTVRKQLMDRERREMDRQLIQSAIAHAQAGDKQLQRILKKQGIDFSQQ